ncbi:MAG: ABC transporter permease, partial [Anaerolineae bacterium]
MHRHPAFNIKRDVISAASIIGVALLAWEVAVRLSNTPPYILPSPSAIAGQLWQNAAYLFAAAGVTLGEALGGLLLGLIVGIATATLITFLVHLERGVLAMAILVKATPMVAIAPLLTIWLGFGPLPKVIITALLTFFPVLINVHSGLHAVDEAVLALFHSLDAGRWA